MKLAIYKKRESGNTMVEFALVAPFWIAVLFGTVAMGTNLTRSIQVLQTSRDLANMYAQGTDFSSPSSQNLMLGDNGNSASLVTGMDLSSTGNTVIYMSQVRHIYQGTDSDCKTTCANGNQEVFTNYITFGNTSLYPSYLGTAPPAAQLDSRDNVKNPTTNTADKTNQNSLFSAGFSMPSNGAVAYVVEVFMSSPDVRFLGFAGAGNYSRAVF
jgi:Flp pilus assembly protein TadG